MDDEQFKWQVGLKGQIRANLIDMIMLNVMQDDLSPFPSKFPQKRTLIPNMFYQSPDTP